MKVATLAALLSLVAQPHLITGNIDRKQSNLDFAQCHVTLNNGEYSALVDYNGAFTISVPDYSANYKLQVHNLHYYFEPVVVEVSEQPF